jgi:hypothetical protein
MSLIKPVIKDALNKLGYDIRCTPPKEAKIKLLDCVSGELQKIEKLADNLTRSEVLKKLRALSLSDFGIFMLSIPNPDFPKLSAVLPRMVKEEVQIGWTGTSGVDLLTQTVDFERATFTCLNTISDHVKPDGLIAVTIRPVEYWDVDPQARRLNLIDQLKEKHNQQGFSFLPHDRPPVDGDITYGDTSVSLDWLKGSFSKLEIAAVDRSLSDPYQMYVFLRKRSAGDQE